MSLFFPSRALHHSRRFLFSACFAFASISVVGCGARNAADVASDGVQRADGALTKIAAAPRPTPRPTPTPNVQAVPNWARGKVVSSVPVKNSDKVVALTFDDGPWPESTRQILRVLADNKVKATFYMVGQEVMRRPEIAREVRDAGHAIGNHSWDHPSRPRDPQRQVKRTDAEIKKVLGFTPTTFRPPYGILKNGMARQAMHDGQPVLLWSADSTDWSRPGVSRIVSRVLNELGPGGISLMHDGGGPREQSVAALPIIISSLRERGYRFVTIPELLRLRSLAPLTKAKKSKSPSSSAKKRRKHGA